MRELTDRLQAWLAAGLVTPDQAQAIAAFEAEHGEAGTPRRTVFAEAVGYVGAALAVGAVALLFANVWEELTTPARFAMVAILSVILFGAGAGLARAERAPLQRLASVLFTGAIAGLGWFAAIVAADVASLEDAQVGLTVGGATLAAALPLYLLRRRPLPQVTLLATILIVTIYALSLPAMAPDLVWYGLTVAAVGAAWFALATGGWLTPRLLGEVTGAVLALIALQVTDERVWPLLIAVALAGGLVVLAVLGDRLHHLVIGSLGLFFVVPRLVFELFGEAMSGPAALLVTGLLLVLLAVGIGRARREVGSSRGRPEPSAPPSSEQSRDDAAPREVRR